MIRIDRSRASAPKSLLIDGPTHLESTIEPRARSGQLRESDFASSIYGNEEIRLRLWRMQHGKCCFCEQHCEVKHETVEHFRPKTEASDDIHGKGTKRAGYWWLAYEFKNLYFCCRKCNTPKSSFFPLEPGALPLPPRALPWTAREQAILLDPAEDPEPHITWMWRGPKHGFVPVGVTERGRQTVRAIDLDQRDTLKRIRAIHYERHVAPVIKRYLAAKKRKDRVALAEARRDALRLTEPDAQYSGMARFVLRKAGIL